MEELLEEIYRALTRVEIHLMEVEDMLSDHRDIDLKEELEAINRAVNEVVQIKLDILNAERRK